MPRFRRPTPGATVFLLALLLIACRVFGVWSDEAEGPFDGERQVTVAHIFDGDTFRTTTGERVRMLGIDAPEVAHHEEVGEPFGQESAQWLRQRIAQQTVILRFTAAPMDRYGRTLAWVYTQDGKLVNAESLRTGHSVLLDSFGLPPSLEPELRAAVVRAKAEKRGLWKP